MIPLVEMMSAMQNSGVYDQFQKNFGLNQEQTQQAFEALMPAFSRGLKQNVSEPDAFASFMQALASGRHQQYADNPQAAFTAEALNEGNALLAQLFGSKDVSRAIAGQAAGLTGIPAGMYKQMLPVLAPILMGGMYKQMTGQMNQHRGLAADANPMAGTPFGAMLEQFSNSMFGAGATNPFTPPAPAASSTPAANPANPWGEIMGEFLENAAQMARQYGQSPAPAAPPAPPKPAPAPSLADNPMGQIFMDMMAGKIPGQDSTPANAPSPAQAPEREVKPQGSTSDNSPPVPDDMFGKMFETGKEMQQEYQKNIDAIFDDFLKGMIRNREG